MRIYLLLQNILNEVPDITERNGVVGWSDRSFVYVYDNENGVTVSTFYNHPDGPG